MPLKWMMLTASGRSFLGKNGKVVVLGVVVLTIVVSCMIMQARTNDLDAGRSQEATRNSLMHENDELKDSMFELTTQIVSLQATPTLNEGSIHKLKGELHRMSEKRAANNIDLKALNQNNGGGYIRN